MTDTQKAVMEEIRKAYLSVNILMVQEERMNRDTFEYMHFAMATLMSKKSSPYPDLTMLITTNGGGYGMEIYDLLNLYPGKIVGLVVNCAMSAGSIILQACDTRLATPNSYLLVHHGSRDVPYDTLLDESKTGRFVAESKIRTEKMYDIYSSRTKMSREEVKKLCFEDRTLFVDEALSLGLLDGIWTKSLPANLADGLKA